ncbi:Chloroperoxidase [Amylocystis lapponica]|nr:Chloroperoxidase [Amylocystis lapponica]
MPSHTTLRLLFKYALLIALTALIMKMILTIDDATRPDFHSSLENHPYVPPTTDDSRSPCPALNALANHNYLPHNGRKITQMDFIRAMRQGYNLSLPLSAFLTLSSHLLLGQFSELSLEDLARHNYIEHNASLAHPDVIGDREYAPSTADPYLIAELLGNSADGKVMTLHDFTKARQHRESHYARPLDALHEEIARGEMSMVLGIFGRGNETVPVEWLEDWWLRERLPADFKPRHQQTLLQTVRTSWRIKSLMHSALGA